MAVTSTRRIINRFSTDDGGITFQSVEEFENVAAPGDVDVQNLSSGANTITPPSGAKGVTIIFPPGNEVLVTLKGVTGDTGIVLHPTAPTSIGLYSASSTFVLTAASALTGIRLIWS